jgi:DNA processing protein
MPLACARCKQFGPSYPASGEQGICHDKAPEIRRFRGARRARTHNFRKCPSAVAIIRTAEVGRASLLRAGVARRLESCVSIHLLPADDARFPTALLAIPDCPSELWYTGCLDALDAPAVAIVGSRAASSVALEIAARLAADLAATGVTIVSGLARGVDSAAHRGALSQGRTVAVLGSGLDVIYPPEHADLARAIAADGLVVSEYPPDTAPHAGQFPMRNRIISGLSRAVVVIEAHERSGSLITARWALQQGRDVMAVPGNPLTGRSRGAHALIRDGAKIVERADDILEELGLVPVLQGESRHDGNAVVPTSCGDSILARMDPGQAYDLDALSGHSGLDGVRLLPRLLDLELRGLVRRVGGGRFMRSS